MTVLRTPRLILRRPRPGDLADVHELLSDPPVMRYWSHPEHETLDQSRDWLQGMIEAGEDSDDFVIEHDGRVIGKAGAWRLPEIGFLLGRPWWGQGLMREALEAVIAHLFATHPVPALTAEADPRNAASLGILGRLGFRETHRAERTLLWRDEWCDSVYLQLDRPDGRPGRPAPDTTAS